MLEPEVQRKLLEAARAMAKRLHVFRRYYSQAIEREEGFVEVNLLWESGDQTALDQFEAVTKITDGEQTTLPLS